MFVLIYLLSFSQIISYLNSFRRINCKSRQLKAVVESRKPTSIASLAVRTVVPRIVLAWKRPRGWMLQYFGDGFLLGILAADLGEGERERKQRDQQGDALAASGARRNWTITSKPWWRGCLRLSHKSARCRIAHSSKGGFHFAVRCQRRTLVGRRHRRPSGGLMRV